MVTVLCKKELGKALLGTSPLHLGGTLKLRLHLSPWSLPELRYWCACICSGTSLTLTHRFDFLAWPWTWLITTDSSGVLNSWLDSVYCHWTCSALFVQVLWDCSFVSDATALPALLLTPSWVLLWSSSLLLLPRCQIQLSIEKKRKEKKKKK